MRPSRSLAAAGLSLTLAAGLLAAPAAATALPGKHPGPTARAGHGEHERAGRSGRAGRALRPFDVRGRVQALDTEAHTVTVSVVQRRHRVRVTQLVPITLALGARIQLNGEDAELEDLQPGDRVRVKGVVIPARADGDRFRLGLRVKAVGERDLPDPEPTDPSPSPTDPTPTPTDPTPTPSPTDPTPEPSPTDDTPAPASTS